MVAVVGATGKRNKIHGKVGGSLAEAPPGEGLDTTGGFEWVTSVVEIDKVAKVGGTQEISEQQEWDERDERESSGKRG